MKLHTLFLMTACMIGVSAYANPAPVYFSPELGTKEDYVTSDWDLTCDNAGTCRAVGYYANEDFDWDSKTEQIVSVLLKRQAGVGKVEGFVNFGVNDDETWKEMSKIANQQPNNLPELFINGKSYGQVIDVGNVFSDGLAQLTEKQLLAIVSQVGKPNFSVQFRWGEYRWTLSDLGLKEVLTEMDKVQGYTNTPLALVQKGNQSAPTKTYAYPKLSDKPFLSAKETLIKRNSQDGQKLLSLLKSPTDSEYDEDYGSCTVLSDDKDVLEFDRDRVDFNVVQVAKGKKLVIGHCWRGAYNMGDGAWLVDNDFTKIHQVVTNNMNYVHNNQIIGGAKGRGIGDCVYLSRWTWDGSKFVHTYAGDTGQCRGFAGGAWQLPSLVIDVASDKDDMKDVEKY